MSKPTTQEIVAKAEELWGDVDHMYIGVRTQEQPFELGAVDHNSVVWDDGDETDEELDGISVTSIESPAVRMHASDGDAWAGYFGEHVALIAYDEYETGYDDGEHVAEDAEVVYIFC